MRVSLERGDALWPLTNPDLHDAYIQGLNSQRELIGLPLISSKYLEIELPMAIQFNLQYNNVNLVLHY